MGSVYSDLKDFDKAEENYLKALELGYTKERVYNNLGWLNEKDYPNHKSDLDKAKEYYLKVLEINPLYATTFICNNFKIF